MCQFKFALFAVVACLVVLQLQAAECGLLGNAVSSFFEERRVSKCPGVEVRLTKEKITIKDLNFPKEPCAKQCQSANMEPIVGSEQAVFGPAVVCCCKQASSSSSSSQ